MNFDATWYSYGFGLVIAGYVAGKVLGIIFGIFKTVGRTFIIFMAFSLLSLSVLAGSSYATQSINCMGGVTIAIVNTSGADEILAINSTYFLPAGTDQPLKFNCQDWNDIEIRNDNSGIELIENNGYTLTRMPLDSSVHQSLKEGSIVPSGIDSTDYSKPFSFLAGLLTAAVFAFASFGGL
jgi:hypothetical protein